MLKEEPSSSADRNRRQPGQKVEQAGYPENIKDPKILAPQRDYTDFGYNTGAKTNNSVRPLVGSDQEQQEPTLPLIDSSIVKVL